MVLEVDKKKKNTFDEKDKKGKSKEFSYVLH